MASRNNKAQAQAMAKRLRKLGKELPERAAGDKFRAAAFRFLQLVDAATPVDTGDLRRSTHVSVNTPTRSDIEVPAGRAVAAGGRVIGGARLGDRIVVQNNKPYARVIEEGLFVPPDPGPSSDPRKGRKGRILVRGGFSVQAPRGMFRDAADIVRREYGFK